MSSPAQRIFRVQSEDDLARIPFEDGMAAVEIPAHLLPEIDMRDYERGFSERLRRLISSIRRDGYRPVEPIVVRIGRKGRWVIVDGGHRITAIRRILGTFLSRLFGPRIGNIYFVIFLTQDSWGDVEAPPGVEIPDRDLDEVLEVREAWDRAQARRN